MTGCIFAPRCAIAEDQCREAAPPAFATGTDRTSRCYRHDIAPDLPRSTPADITLQAAPQEADDLVVRLQGVSKTFAGRDEQVQALAGVDLELQRGETLGLVGESGSGKTTLARVLLGLIPADPGAVVELDNQPLPPELRARTREQL